MNKKLLPILVECTISGNKINTFNCKNWSFDDQSCTVSCKINETENPDFLFCSKCEKRNPYSTEEVPELRTENLIKRSDEKSFVEKAKSYVRAEASQAFSGKVTDEVYEKRKEICMRCEYRVNNIKHLTDDIGWCKGGCGCAVGNPRSALSQKLYMPSLLCPKGKFGIETGKGFNVKDATDSVKGVMTSVKNIFEKDK